MTTPTTRTHPDLAALLRAVLLDPADDVLRLILADFLEEDGQAERAEFVRVQVELATLPEPEETMRGYVDVYDVRNHCRRCRELRESWGYCRYHLLRIRERDLLAVLLPRNALLPPFASGWEAFIRADRGGWYLPPWDDGHRIEATFSRGLVSAIACPLAAYLEHAAALFGAHPITAVRLTDCEPEPRGEALAPPLEAVGWWDREYFPVEDRGDLPRCLHELLPRAHSLEISGWAWYATPALAHAALSAACVRHGRALAHLPPLPLP